MQRLRSVGAVLFVLLIIMGAITACGGGGGGDGDDNALPEVIAGADQTANEGDVLDFSGSFSDADTGDTHTWEWDFGDGSADATTLTPSHAYADNGVYTVTLTVTDSSGGIGEDSLTVTVANVAPAVDAGENQTVTEGDLVSFAASVMDPGSADTFTYEWDFGDLSAVSTSEAPTHVYGTADEYTVTVTVTDDDGDSDSDTLTVTVQSAVIDLGSVSSAYVNAPNWNDYVNSDGSVASTTGIGGYSSVIHGGEMRAVAVSGVAFCDGISAEDNLGAFIWTCVEGTDPVTDPASVVSAGLAEGFSLSDLIDFGIPAWRGNHVTVYQGAAVYGTSSLDQIWWDNPVEAINDPAVALTSQGDIGTIYAVADSLGGNLEIASHKVALVTDADAGVKIRGYAAAADVVQAADVSFLWIEADLMGASGSTQSGDILSLSGVQYSVLRNVSASRSGTGSGIYLYNSRNDFLRDVVIADNYRQGLYLYLSWENVVTDVRSYNNNSTVMGYGGGVLVRGGGSNILSNLTSFNNYFHGVQFYQTDDNVLTSLTAANNNGHNLAVWDSLNNVYFNLGVVNGTEGLMVAADADNNIFGNLASGHNTYGVRLVVATEGNKFEGALRLGGNTNNFLDEGTNSSEAVTTDGLDFTESFVGKVATDDTVNSSDTDGSALYVDIQDWIHFENEFRGWGKDGDAFPSQTNRSFADSTMSLRIWDWSLNAADPAPVLALLEVLDAPSAADTQTHTWSNASMTEFLMNAVEIMGDHIGNDNGLCEPAEVEDCVFTPNIGSYQGHGSLLEMASQPVAGITLYEYEYNGR